MEASFVSKMIRYIYMYIYIDIVPTTYNVSAGIYKAILRQCVTVSPRHTALFAQLCCLIKRKGAISFHAKKCV